MFCVIYRAWILDGQEKRYQELWKTLANYFVKSRGALGSTLHKTEEGYWLAYSRWPDKKTRDASWTSEGESPTDLPSEILQAILDLKSCVDQERKFPEIGMEWVTEV